MTSIPHRLAVAFAPSTILALLLLLSAPSVPLEAQSRTSPGGVGYFATGIQEVEIEELNQRLLSLGYQEVDGRMLTIGGGGFGVRGRTLMIGGEGYALFSGESTSDGRDVRVAGGYGLFRVGYLIEMTDELWFHPTVGIGAGGLAVTIGPQGTSDGFDDVLLDPNRESSLSQGSILASVGMGGHYRFGGLGGGPLLGLDVGYTFQPYASNWRLGGSTLSDGPDAGITGLYVRVSIGGGR